MTPQNDSNKKEFTKAETEQRFAAALKRALSTPHKPHKPLKAKAAKKKVKK